LGLTEANIDFEKRMIMPNGHSGVNKNSYTSFYNWEAEEVLNNFKASTDRLFDISDRQYKKSGRTLSRGRGCARTKKEVLVL
jgi:hypothetical protein